MCGIAGVITASSSTRIAEDVKRMSDAIIHRGPDASGVWVDENSGVGLAHRRLSILDLSAAGSQPMQSDSQRYVISYNGEVYNHLELRKELDKSWRGDSDTETLLSAIDTWGIEGALNRAVGMFSLALWDRQEKVLTLARDRMGEKPLYYGRNGGNFYFASELKALRAHPDFKGTICRSALTLYVRHGYVPTPYSIFEGIYKLEAGSWLGVKCSDFTTVKNSFWSLNDIALGEPKKYSHLNDNKAVQLFEECLSTAVRRQLISDVPLGALLSGGIDSSTVVTAMQMNSAKPVKTFTIGFNEINFNEADSAKSVAAHLGTDHTEMYINHKDALDIVPSLPQIYDEPFADSSQIPTHIVMKLARNHVTVALSGDGGDELLGGYNRYTQVPEVWKRLRWMPRPIRRSIAGGLNGVSDRALNQMLKSLAGLFNVAQAELKIQKLGQRLNNISSIETFYLELVSEWPVPESVVLSGSVPDYLLGNRKAWPDTNSFVEKMMILDSLSYLPDDILVKVDRASMAASLESRAPFLDRDLIKFCWGLPHHMKIRDGQGKWILRRFLEQHIPAALTERPKMGFGVPLDDWLRGPLRDWADDLLSEHRLQCDGYFSPQIVRSAWQSHVSGKKNYAYRLWGILMFQAWLHYDNS